jgi:hypothetical protein
MAEEEAIKRFAALAERDYACLGTPVGREKREREREEVCVCV